MKIEVLDKSNNGSVKVNGLKASLKLNFDELEEVYFALNNRCVEFAKEAFNEDGTHKSEYYYEKWEFAGDIQMRVYDEMKKLTAQKLDEEDK